MIFQLAVYQDSWSVSYSSLYGYVVVLSLQVPGNFHVSTHSATAQPQSPEMTHLIHKLAFGEKPLVSTVLSFLLCLSDRSQLCGSYSLAKQRHYLGVIWTFQERLSQRRQHKHVFSLSVPPLQEYVAYSHTGRIIPAIWYRYDLSPISQVHREETTSLPVHNYDLCYHRGDVHGSRHHRLLYIHSLRGLEEDPDRKDVPRTYHYAVPRTYHYAVPRTYHYAVPRTYHYAVPRTYHYAVPRTYHYA
ncbi:unnamed protein product, partial [Oncorhynchus mykiss]